MSFDPETSATHEPWLPSLEQLQALNERVHKLLKNARRPIEFEGSVGVYFHNRYDYFTSVGLGRALPYDDTVDVSIKRLISQDIELGLSTLREEEFAYSPSGQATLYQDRLAVYRDGHRVRDEEEVILLELAFADLDAAFSLAAGEDAPEGSDSALAQAMRKYQQRFTDSDPLETTLTADRVDRALEELSWLKPEHEELPLNDRAIEKMLPRLFADIMEDEHMQGGGSPDDTDIE